MSRRGLGWIIASVLVLAGSWLTAVAPAGAVGAFGPPVNIISGAGITVAASDAAIGVDGTLRGFLSMNTVTSYPPPARVNASIVYFRMSPGGVVTDVPSPYHGLVVRVAWDGSNSTYVVYHDGSRLYVGKYVESSGAFAPPTLLTSRGSFQSAFAATLTASNGTWWAVWAENDAPSTAKSPHNQLFQAHTLLGRQGRTQITSLSAQMGDDDPALAFYGGQVSLLWTRYTRLWTAQTLSLQASVLRLARSSGGSWAPRTLTAGGTHNGAGDIVVYGGTTYLVWERDHTRVMFASNYQTGGVFTTHSFANDNNPYNDDAFGQTVAVSGTSVFLAWLDSTGFVAVAERHDGVWSTAFPVGGHTYSNRILARATKAALLYSDQLVVRQT